jgi:lysophospholipase L1-like esterase
MVAQRFKLTPLLAVGAALACLSHAAALSNAYALSVPLRIMPLGASVTFGVGSTTGDSYRKDLLGLLTSQQGATVEYVGTETCGSDFAQNACQAKSGDVIAQIAAKAAVSVPRFQPNVVLVDMGTNNCNEGGTVPEAGANVTRTIRQIYADAPGATVVLATLLVNAVPAQEACRQTVNPQYESLAAQLASEGHRIVLVDMRSPPAPLVGLTTKDLNGTRHPSDGGYAKMAAIWQSGIVAAASKGFLVAPIALGGGGANGTASASASGNATVSFTSSAAHGSKTAASGQAATNSQAAMQVSMASTGMSAASGPTSVATAVSTSGSVKTAPWSVFGLLATWCLVHGARDAVNLARRSGTAIR